MTKKTQFKPHKYLDDYRLRGDYPKIAQAAGIWARKNPNATVADLMAWVKAEYGESERVEMRKNAAPLEVFGTVGDHIPANALDQMYTILRLPVTTRGALMPDAHLGYAMPIGGVVGLENAISPSFVGYDISCMVQLSLLAMEPEAFMTHREDFAEILRGVTSFGMGSDFARGKRSHQVMDDPAWDEISIPKKLKSLAGTQLGSSGGGNHFADLVVVEFMQDHDRFRAGDQMVGLLTHSGSRGTGHKIATHYVRRAQREIHAISRAIPKGYEWLSLETESGQAYLVAMQLMGRYARANHDLIHDHFVAESKVAQLQRIWNRHNYAWVDEESGEVIHRKGATPADEGQLGLIPGTSGTASYLVRGLGNPESMHSSAHGAGRYFSRSEAKRRHNERAFQRHMEQADILHFGLSPDETFQAYKDIEMVMELQNGILVEPVARMTPKVVIMGGRSDDGD